MALGKNVFFDDRKNSDVLLKDFFSCRNCYKQSNCVDAVEGECQKKSVNLPLSNNLSMAVPLHMVIQEEQKSQNPSYRTTLKSFTL